MMIIVMFVEMITVRTNTELTISIESVDADLWYGLATALPLSIRSFKEWL